MYIRNAFIVAIPKGILDDFDILDLTGNFEYRDMGGHRCDVVGCTMYDYLLRFLAGYFSKRLGLLPHRYFSNIGIDNATLLLGPFFSHYLTDLDQHTLPSFIGPYFSIDFIDPDNIIVKDEPYFDDTRIMPTTYPYFIPRP